MDEDNIHETCIYTVRGGTGLGNFIDETCIQTVKGVTE